MRKGQNPAKAVNEVVKPERITVAVLNYIPFVSGFFAEMPQVLKACLDSVHNDAGLPFDLLVFDNGSCEEVQQYLLDEQAAGRIQYLILSEKNLGKGGAWNMILSSAPGEIIVYADNDVLFYPGWLKRSVEILETYPRAGMVTARPFRTKLELCTATEQWAVNTPDVQRTAGQLLAWENFLEFNLSLGQDEEKIRADYAASQDVRLTYRGVTAQVGASHWQFAAYKSVMQEFLPFDMERPMGQVRQLDERVNAAGYLRLMTSDPLAMNMSNTPQVVATNKQVEKISLGKRLLEFPPVKALLHKVYDLIFQWYYRS
jgi:glycosyltransferase involved in cell wall biosynthesis